MFSVAEFRALWGAQFLSVIGDQLARVALTVLVYDRTRSALLAAVTFVVSIVPAFVGGVTLAWLADRYPRRGVMIACDLGRCALVLVMAIPGVPLAGLVALLFLVDCWSAPVHPSARAAIYPDVLAGDRYVTGTAVTLTTYQFAQVLGFAGGGAVTAFFGTRLSLIIDAATFAASALIVQTWVRSRPAPARTTSEPHEPSRLAGIFGGARLVFGQLGTAHADAIWLAGRVLQRPGGRRHPARAGTWRWRGCHRGHPGRSGPGRNCGRRIMFSGFVAPPTRLRFIGPLAISTCAIMVFFFWRPGLAVSLLILVASGLCAAYQLAANAAFVSAAPQEQRSQAFGLAQGGMSLGQGIVLILAGAAAEHFAPARVIAVCGAVGAVVALGAALAGAAIAGRGRTDAISV